MTTWKLSPQYKKSAVEKMFFYNEGKVIIMLQGYRWANFTVESDERPLTDEELVNEDGYELGSIDNDESWEMWDMIDGCWCDIGAGNDKTTDEDVEAFEAAWEEDSYEGVEALGWSQDDCEYYYHGPLELTNEDTGEVFKGEPNEPVTTEAVKEFVEGYADVVENMSDEEWDNLGKEDTVITDWYPVKTNPVRAGTYQVLDSEFEVSWPFQSNVTSATWDGKKWDSKKVVKWRGLNYDPSK
jgi:hypothetical protein